MLGRYWPEPFIRVAEICTNPMAAYWFKAILRLLWWRIGGIGQKPSSKSIDQGVIAEVVEHNKRGRYPSDKTSDEYLQPLPDSYCVMYGFIYLYLLVE